MNSYGSSEDHQPLTWVRGYPIYAAYAVVAAYVLSMIVTTLLMATHVQAPFEVLPFASERVLKGEIWRIFTYGFLNPPSLGFAIDMAMIAWFGRELEKFFGRNKFLSLYAGLYFLAPLVLTLVGLRQPMGLLGESSAFALFVAFATLYPNVSFFFNILAGWLAIILVALYSLMSLSARDTTGLITLWTSVGFAFLFVRYQQGQLSIPSFRRSRPRPPVEPAPRAVFNSSLTKESMTEVDALLDKIAKSGISSLNPQERARLDAARDEMKRKAKPR